MYVCPCVLSYEKKNVALHYQSVELYWTCMIHVFGTTTWMQKYALFSALCVVINRTYIALYIINRGWNMNQKDEYGRASLFCQRESSGGGVMALHSVSSLHVPTVSTLWIPPILCLEFSLYVKLCLFWRGCRKCGRRIRRSWEISI